MGLGDEAEGVGVGFRTLGGSRVDKVTSVTERGTNVSGRVVAEVGERTWRHWNLFSSRETRSHMGRHFCPGDGRSPMLGRKKTVVAGWGG